jgi:hypothetical protein
MRPRRGASQKDQGGEIVQRVDGHNSDEYEPEDRRRKREAPAHRLEQVIEDERHGGITRERDQLSGETQTVQRLVRQDIGRCSRGVAMYNKSVANEELGEWGRDEDEQVEDAGHSGLETRRRFCNSFSFDSLQQGPLQVMLYSDTWEMP